MNIPVKLTDIKSLFKINLRVRGVDYDVWMKKAFKALLKLKDYTFRPLWQPVFYFTFRAAKSRHSGTNLLDI